MSLKGEGKFLVKIARTYRGKCYLCYRPIVSGEAYVMAGASNTNTEHPAHYDCYKPKVAPEVRARGSTLLTLKG